MFAAAAAAAAWFPSNQKEDDKVWFREATMADLPSLLELEQRLIKDEQPFDAWNKGGAYYDLPDLLTSKSRSTLVVAEASQPTAAGALQIIVATGYVQLRPSKTYHTHDVHGYIGFCYTAPEFRGKCIAGTPGQSACIVLHRACLRAFI